MEEELTVAETEKGDTVSTQEDTNVDMSSNRPVKRGRGRPQGSKKIKVCVTELNLTKLASANSNREPQKGRGRPKLSLTKHTEQQDQSGKTLKGRGRPKGFKVQISAKDGSKTKHDVVKRGRPRKSVTPEKAEGLLNGGSDAPTRGCPKGSRKHKSESLKSGEEEEGGSVTPQKRGRPKGSLNKTPRLEKEMRSEWGAGADTSRNSVRKERGRPRKVGDNNAGEVAQNASNGISKTSGRGRGRPKKSIDQRSGGQETVTGASQLAKRGRGRPKGSCDGNVGRPRKVPSLLVKERKRGRPRQIPAKRGRPRKYPLPISEKLKKPKVWKPLGRPRKYPRAEPPEGTPMTPQRGRGRPRKSEVKKGAHLRKSMLTTPSTPHTPAGGLQKKRGRPPSTVKHEGGSPRKRGRPKGSVNKSKAKRDAQSHSSLSNHSTAESVSPAAESESEAEAGLDAEVPVQRETVLVQDASFDLSEQA